MDNALIEKVARALCQASGGAPDEPVKTGKLITRQVGNTQFQEDETRPKWRSFEAEARSHIAAWSVLRDVS